MENSWVLFIHLLVFFLVFLWLIILHVEIPASLQQSDQTFQSRICWDTQPIVELPGGHFGDILHYI